MAFWLLKGQYLDISVAQKAKILFCDYKSLDTSNTESPGSTKKEVKIDSTFIAECWCHKNNAIYYNINRQFPEMIIVLSMGL